VAAVRYMVDDLRAATAFYIEHLGCTEKENWGPIVILERDDLELWLSGPGTSAAKHSVVGNRFVLRVDDLDQALAELKEQGIDPEREPYRVREGGSLLCFVNDPDGYRIELIDRSGT